MNSSAFSVPVGSDQGKSDSDQKDAAPQESQEAPEAATDKEVPDENKQSKTTPKSKREKKSGLGGGFGL